MSFQKRKQIIIEKLEAFDALEVPEIALILGVSEITVRRDLNTLEKEGLIVRTHGGAMKANQLQIQINFNRKTAQNGIQKEEICKKAANLVNDGETVFLDCGSTVFKLCKFLKDKKIRVVTNSLPIVNALLGTKVSINFIGGEIDADRQATHGIAAVEHIKKYKADKAFIGVDGISLENGLSAHSEKEAEIALALMHNASDVYFLCDGSKFENDKYYKFASLKIIKNLITDSQASQIIIDKYTKKGLKFY
jgi:DeoR family transcriptional regulator, fructose operon transcriptional repressor